MRTLQTHTFGRYFEELEPGEVIEHWPGRTITETDNTWFAQLTMNQHPLHSDAAYAAGFKRFTLEVFWRKRPTHDPGGRPHRTG